MTSSGQLRRLLGSMADFVEPPLLTITPALLGLLTASLHPREVSGEVSIERLLNSVEQRRLVPFHGQHEVRPWSTTWAVIAFEFSSITNCPELTLFAPIHALTL